MISRTKLIWWLMRIGTSSRSHVSLAESNQCIKAVLTRKVMRVVQVSDQFPDHSRACQNQNTHSLLCLPETNGFCTAICKRCLRCQDPIGICVKDDDPFHSSGNLIFAGFFSKRW